MIPNCACHVAISHMETLKMQRNALNKQIGEKRKVSISCSLSTSVLTLRQAHAVCNPRDVVCRKRRMLQSFNTRVWL